MLHYNELQLSRTGIEVVLIYFKVLINYNKSLVLGPYSPTPMIQKPATEPDHQVMIIIIRPTCLV
jgi:hypothetical protein